MSNVVKFSKSQWDRFSDARKKAEETFAKLRGQRIEIYTKK